MNRGGLRGEGLLGNPFVVFTDVTISLACIFLIYGLATSQALAGVTRMERQQLLLGRIATAFAKVYPDAPPMVQEDKLNEHGQVEYRPWVLRRRGEQHRVADIQINGGLFRISLYEAPFAPDSSAVVADDKPAKVFLEFAREVAKEHDNYTYLFLQGISEKKEVAWNKDRGMSLSVDRANAARQFLEANGVIGRYPEPPSGTQTNYVWPSRVITFGTGFWLYQTDEEARGRVDMFIYFNDSGEVHAKRD
jgi:hypothetical protein